MAFEPIRGKGVNRARVCCDFCDRSEVMTCGYVRGSDPGKTIPNARQLFKKISKRGWSVIKGKVRCPSCEASRKVVRMIKAKTKPQVVADPPREPTRAQNREIMVLLGDVYDAEQERYRRGDTDETVAEVLEVMPGWVARLREEFFGPAGGNEDMVALADDLRSFIVAAGDVRQKAQGQIAALEAEIRQAEKHLVRLGEIEKAVGPRLLARAG